MHRNGTPPDARTFLFLQGLASPFFADLARALAARGHGIRRINFNLGDRLFWRGSAIDYTGDFVGWQAFAAALMAGEGVTDVVLFGDCRPYHRVAIAVAKAAGICVHVFEEGYIRPDWITVERDGVNGHSSLPRDPAALQLRSAQLSPPALGRPVRGDMRRRAAWDVSYNVATAAGRLLYPGFERHRPHHPFAEYAGWLKRLSRRGSARRAAAETVARLEGRPGGFYVAPLQLDSDYQVRSHAAVGGVKDFIDMVVRSFAGHAPGETELVVKGHPLDNGLVNWGEVVEAAAAAHGVTGRVTFIDGGDLQKLLRACRGVALINSTVGVTALEFGRPLIALGSAIYRMPGLTFDGSLDRFWTEGRAPNRALVRAFERVVIADTQVNGGFFHPESLALAVAGAVTRLETRGASGAPAGTAPALAPTGAGVPATARP